MDDGMGFGLVSVVMAAYNAERTIRQAVLSVLAQTYQNLELLVVDDGSKDNTIGIIKEIAVKDKRVKLICCSGNHGVSYARKCALDEASGEWIAILDSDDAWMPDKLEKQIGFQKVRKAELIFTGSAFMDRNGGKMVWELHVPEEISYRKLLKQNLVSNSSVLVKKSLYKQFYVEDDNMHEDFAVWLAITKTGINAYGIDEPLLIYRLTQSSKSGNKLHAAKMNWNTYRHTGLSVLESCYYMVWYTINGFLKYKNLRQAMSACCTERV